MENEPPRARHDAWSGAERLPVPGTDWALLLDVDGTLLEIAPAPDAVRVPDDLVPTLERLARRLEGAVALVSGRPIADVDRLVAPLRLPAAGLHGLERRSAGGSIVRTIEPSAELAHRARALAETFADDPAVLVEFKGLSVALHFRQAPEREGMLRAIVEREAAALGPAFHVQEGKKVLEIKPVAANKGSVVHAFMQESPFAGRRPVFVGDDHTDEDGFAAVNDYGGYAIRVGRGESRAPWRAASVASLRRWLRDVAGPAAGSTV